MQTHVFTSGWGRLDEEINFTVKPVLRDHLEGKERVVL